MDMSLEQLEKFVSESGNEEVIGALDNVKKSFENNVDRLTFLEKEMKTATEKRDSIKNLVKNKFGIDEVSDESLGSIAEKLNSNNKDNVEVENLTSMLESLRSEKETISSKYEETVNSYKLEKTLAKLGAIEETESSKAYDILLNEIKSGAEFGKDDEIVFKTSDGTTIRNADGSPVTLADRYNQLKQDDSLSFLFKTKRSKAGSGAQRSGSYSKESEYFDRNSENFSLTKQAEIYKTNPALYKQLKG
jgi:hypothetical protein